MKLVIKLIQSIPLLLLVITSLAHAQVLSLNDNDNHSNSSKFKFTVVKAPFGYEAWTSQVILPSPIQDGSAGYADYINRAKKFVSQLTIEEKVNLTTGTGYSGQCVGNTGTVPRLNFLQPICLQDGPVGVRKTDLNSVFPAAINTAATFDKQIFYVRSKAMAVEFVKKGVHVGLAPMTNLMRTPESGRAWEGFGSDPFLSGVATAQSVLGIQDAGLSACVKHYIGNEQEHYRGGSGGTASSSNIEDRSLRELYDWPFAEAVQVGVDYVMCSYNRINQTHACENSKLINGLLKTEKKFQGVLVTDWAAAVSGVRTSLAGSDMNMPGFIAYKDGSEGKGSENPSIAKNSYWGARLVEAVKNGSIPIERIDDMVTRVISTYYKRGHDRADYPSTDLKAYGPGTPSVSRDVQSGHGQLIREIGAASTVLLKNVKNTLPLKPPSSLRSVAIIGSDAADNPKGPNGCVDRGCDNGTLAAAWGSGTAEFPYLISPTAAITEFIHSANPQTTIQSVLSDDDIHEIQRTSAGADVAIVHVNADAGEGYITVEGNMGDRNNLSLWHQGDRLILKTAEVCNNVVVVVHSVGPVDLEAWIDHANVTAVVWAGLPGQETGNSEVDILWGAVNPSGRLPYTIGKKRSDYPSPILLNSNMKVPQIMYSENLEIDYRHFDARHIKPRFEYGFGLSYTTFKYSNLAIDTHHITLGLYDNLATVRFRVANTGLISGHEVAQLYVSFPAAAGEPPKVLRGFERVFIEVKKDINVAIPLRKKDLSIWDVKSQNWILPSGVFKIMVGSSSRKIHLTQAITL